MMPDGHGTYTLNNHIIHLYRLYIIISNIKNIGIKKTILLNIYLMSLVKECIITFAFTFISKINLLSSAFTV